MNVIQLGIQVAKGERIDRDEYAKRMEREAARISNGYAVLDGLSLDVIDGRLTVNAYPVAYHSAANSDNDLFVMACMLDSAKMGKEAIIGELESIGELTPDLQKEEKAMQYVTLVQRSIKKFWLK